MIDSITLWLSDAEKTAFAGASLASSLYSFPLDIRLTGELGAGKTTFLQGFARALGIRETLTSPTFALEQRYHTRLGIEFLHSDLHRLSEKQARELIAGTDGHPGIRCIEWADRIRVSAEFHHIDLQFREENGGRFLTCSFLDLPLPTRDEIMHWRREVHLPEHIIRHCDAVADTAIRIANILVERGTLLRPKAIMRAAEVHDLLRFIDFRPGGAPSGSEDNFSSEIQAVYDDWKHRYPGLKHEAACAVFLREKGFAGLADIVEVHGLTLPAPERTTVEQKILFYADKRMKVDEFVTLDERFEDFRKRYGHGQESEQSRIWYSEAKRIEMELFPEGAP